MGATLWLGLCGGGRRSALTGHLFFFLIFIFIYLFVSGLSYESLILVVACGIWFLDQGLNLGPLHWEHGVLATGLPGKSFGHLLKPVLHRIENSSGPSLWPLWSRAQVTFLFFPKKGNAKECSNYCTITLISYASKVMLKILQARLQQYMNRELSHVQIGFRKSRGTRDQIANICWIIEKAREFQEKHLLH